ncbi:MAG: NFACT RNA binding domain-containing protein, partial [Oscillospiraceae bacterium]
MAIDAAMIYVAARELRERLENARMDKLYMPARDEVVFSLRTPDGPCKLLASARSGGARVHLTLEEYENPAVPYGFCMLLRKHLATSRITGFRTVDGERILFVDFDAMAETGERVAITLSIELMGRYCNLVLIGADGRVIDALKRISAEDSDKRQLYPGCEFTLPPPQNKISFMTSSNDELIARVCSLSKPLSGALLETAAGLSPLLCREIAFRTDPLDLDAASMNEEQRALFEKNLSFVRAAAQGEGICLNIASDGERAVEFSFVELTQYGGCSVEKFDSVSALCDRYFGERDRAERAKSRSFDLLKQVNSLCERARRKQTARLSERDNSELAAQKRLYGELVNANLHSITKGERSAKLLNYYTGEEIEIPLDPTKTPVQNSQRYFKEYKKLTTAAAMIGRLLTDGAREIKYLESVKYELCEARTEEDFSLIRRELLAAGYLRSRKRVENKKLRKMSEYTRYRTSDGMLVLVGRNNTANDKLTLKTADKRDIWFHIKDAAGAHVVLAAQGEKPTDLSLTEATE